MRQYSEIPLCPTPEERQLLDSAKRLSDLVNNICVFQPVDVVTRSWIAVRLSDGGYDGTLYDSRADAVRHQFREQDCCYLYLREALAGMPIREAYVYLKFHRDVYDADRTNPRHSIRLVDPEASNGGYDTVMPIAYEDVRRQIRRMRQRIERGR